MTNHSELVKVVLFVLGWLLYVLAQAQNSVKSKTNGLTGLKAWFQMHAVNLATRAFFSGLAYGFIVHTVASKVESVGLQLEASSIAGIGGYAANALLYQFFGYLPWLRVEVADLAPPASTPAPPPNPGPPA
jgi:uncharacterized membrane protein YhdT